MTPDAPDGGPDSAGPARPARPGPRPGRRATDPGFDRLRPRSTRQPPIGPESVAAQPDQEGRRALFSDSAPPASLGAVTVSCSSCGTHTVVSARQALLLALPSLHLPYLRRGHGSWMRCPACGRRTWVSLRVTL